MMRPVPSKNPAGFHPMRGLRVGLLAAPLLLLAGAPRAAAPVVVPCDYYAAAPSGSPPGSSLNRGTAPAPFLMRDFWPKVSAWISSGRPAGAGPGITLCLENGVYQGAASMVAPTSGLSGISSKPVTVRA